jgi:hypothetical protein
MDKGLRIDDITNIDERWGLMVIYVVIPAWYEKVRNTYKKKSTNIENNYWQVNWSSMRTILLVGR